MIRIILIPLILASCSPKQECVVRTNSNEKDSLIREIDRRDAYLRTMVDVLIRKDIPIDSAIGKTIIEIGKL